MFAMILSGSSSPVELRGAVSPVEPVESRSPIETEGLSVSSHVFGGPTVELRLEGPIHDEELF
jgi:hypothetical protein